MDDAAASAGIEFKHELIQFNQLAQETSKYNPFVPSLAHEKGKTLSNEERKSLHQVLVSREKKEKMKDNRNESMKSRISSATKICKS